MTAESTDPHVAAPLKIGDDIGLLYKVSELTPTRLKLQTSYGLGAILFVAAIAMGFFDYWLLNQRVLSHVLLAMNGSTALAFKGAMIVLPLFVIPMVAYSLGRGYVVDADLGVAQRRSWFFFVDTVKLEAVKAVAIRLEPRSSGIDAALRLVDAAGEPLMEFPSETAEREEILSHARTLFAKLLALAQQLSTLTHCPLQTVGDVEKMSTINVAMLNHATGRK